METEIDKILIQLSKEHNKEKTNELRLLLSLEINRLIGIRKTNQPKK